ncbi:HEPN domain-containing protein [Marinilabilia rubra]|uniref:HEPN domain-containing protein n=1 Tax=Marinilabilia rubra TaxID=2162893 RepID=A0A2U2B3U6_9BACT|nr:HEPN domain-containing protein [Marinilabilia rubra]PWD97736.1 hypothetical protein DDZ16_19055 [Marinilabilia rubra]
MTQYKEEDYINYRIERARETILEVQTHIENEFWNTAINRMYYACFYAVSALLFKNNIEVASHSGIRNKFGEVFVKTGIINREIAKHYTDLFEKRQKGDYNDFFDYDEETVLRLFPKSQQFIDIIEKALQQ